MPNEAPFGNGKKKRKEADQKANNFAFWNPVENITQTNKQPSKANNPYLPSQRQLSCQSSPFYTQSSSQNYVQAQNKQPGNPSHSFGRGFGDPGQPIFPDDIAPTKYPVDNNEPIFPDIPNKKSLLGNPVDTIGAVNLGTINPVHRKTDQKIRPGISGQAIRTRNPGEPIYTRTLQSIIPNQTLPQFNPTQTARLEKPNQSIRPGNFAQTNRTGNPIQSITSNNPIRSIPQKKPTEVIHPGNPGPPIRPSNSSQQKHQNTNSVKPSQPGVLRYPKPAIDEPGQGPKFKPLQEVEQPQLIRYTEANEPDELSLPKPTSVEQSIFQNDNPVITIVGKNTNRVNSISQQKKILKFQMRLQTMQQEKQRQAKVIQCKTLSEDPGSANTLHKPDGTANQQPMLHNFSGTQKTMGTGVQQKQNIQIPAPHAPQELVETAFHLDVDHNTYAPPGNPIPQAPLNSLKGSWTQVDIYGFKYPKGIPKSFLMQQKNQANTKPADAPIWPSYQPNAMSSSTVNESNATSPLVVLTDGQKDTSNQQPYSPSELYTDLDHSLSQDGEESESSDLQSGQKRLSAFRRLGPQTQPKKPKLTISVTVNEDQEVRYDQREVVDQTEELEEITPVHLREDMLMSTDDTVVKYLKSWPWKRNVVLKKTVTARSSKTVMIMEREQMEEIYDRDTVFLQVSVKGYPPTWTKEQVLNALMENLKGYSFIPCFIEFTREECKFLVIRCRSALLCFHKCGFIINKDNIELVITIAQTELMLTHLDFVPRLILRKRLNMCIDTKSKLDLSAFTMKEDISHFIYFPLFRIVNQMELVQMHSDVVWCNLTVLNLSHNKISSLEGFDLEHNMPKLKHLNLSYNCIERITMLIKCRALPLKSIHLEGNPLCTDYLDPEQYVKVVKMMFPSVIAIDDEPVTLKGDMPRFRRNYCPTDAKALVEKFLEVYFPLLDGDIEHRVLLQDMYEDNATMTITFHYRMAFGPIYRCFKTLFQNARQFEEDNMDMIKGSSSIIKTITSWPHMEHDPFTFTVDVLHHDDATTILRVDGILKLTRESLAEDEHLLSFSRTLVLHTRDYVEYKIQSEMLHWKAPTSDYARSAFAVTAVKPKQMYPKIEATSDEGLQQDLLKIFMKLTSMNKETSEKYLEDKKWNLKEALEHFVKQMKPDDLESHKKDGS